MEKMGKGGASEDAAVAARRRFLATCGKFAIVTPPVVSLMLSASHRSYAQVGSGGGYGGGHGGHHHHHGDGHGHGNNGFGNGGHDGVPGHSHHEDNDR